MEILQAILNLFVRYGYFFLFFATALENIPVVGIFLPGEVVVVAAGFFAASGEFDPVTVVLVAVAGAFIGTVCSYALGFWGGRQMIEAVANKVRLDGERLKDADEYFTTHGHITVFVGRYLTGIKAFVPALAGTHRMSFPVFLVFAFLGIATWTILATILGYFFGSNWVALIRIIKTAGWLILSLVVLFIAAIWYRRHRR